MKFEFLLLNKTEKKHTLQKSLSMDVNTIEALEDLEVSEAEEITVKRQKS